MKLQRMHLLKILQRKKNFKTFPIQVLDLIATTHKHLDLHSISLSSYKKKSSTKTGKKPNWKWPSSDYKRCKKSTHKIYLHPSLKWWLKRHTVQCINRSTMRDFELSKSRWKTVTLMRGQSNRVRIKSMKLRRIFMSRRSMMMIWRSIMIKGLKNIMRRIKCWCRLRLRKSLKILRHFTMTLLAKGQYHLQRNQRSRRYLRPNKSQSPQHLRNEFQQRCRSVSKWLERSDTMNYTKKCRPSK